MKKVAGEEGIPGLEVTVMEVCVPKAVTAAPIVLQGRSSHPHVATSAPLESTMTVDVVVSFEGRYTK